MFLIRARIWTIGAALAASACGGVRSEPIKGPPSTGNVRVVVKAPKGVELWELQPAANAMVCAAPCTREVVPEGRQFEARVTDMPDSPVFDIPKASRGAVVEVEPAPKVLPGLGAVVGTVGAGAMIAGTVFLLGDVTGNEDMEGTALAGGITVLAGGAVLAAGIVLAALSGTHVKVREALNEPPALRF